MASDPETPHQSSADGIPDDWVNRLRLRIPRYRLLNEISQGGQAIVYRAETEEFPLRIVAIKVLRDGPLADDHARERLRREAGVLAVLKNPNIVKAIEWGRTDDGNDFLVMDYIDGQPLDRFLSSFRSSEASRTDPSALPRLFLKICDAVEAAHKHGIVHRDLSPSNILVDRRSEPQILDFGLARTAFDRYMRIGPNNGTVTGQFLGKFAYASPEQARCKPEEIDIRTDVYALGVILYGILTDGQFPYEVVGGIHQVLDNILHAKPRPLTAGISDKGKQRKQGRKTVRKCQPTSVNAVVNAIVMKALEKNPENRYRSAGEFATDLRNYFHGQPTLAKSVMPITRRLRLPTIRFLALFVGSLLLVVFCGMAIWKLNSEFQKDAIPSVDVNSIAAIVQQADSATDGKQRVRFAQEARIKLRPHLSDPPRQEVMRLASRIALICEDQELAVWANQAFQKQNGIDLQSPPQAGSELLKLNRLAAEGGDKWSMVRVGLTYQNGWEGVTPDGREAVYWYLKAVDAGSGHAMVLMGIAYQNGNCGLDKSEAKAVAWYRKSAEAGYPPGMYFLGSSYELGTGGLKPDSDSAFYWYNQGAALGDSGCMCGLGGLYSYGGGHVSKDASISNEWYRQAARKGDESAKNVLKAKGLSW